MLLWKNFQKIEKTAKNSKKFFSSLTNFGYQKQLQKDFDWSKYVKIPNFSLGKEIFQFRQVWTDLGQWSRFHNMSKIALQELLRNVNFMIPAENLAQFQPMKIFSMQDNQRFLRNQQFCQKWDFSVFLIFSETLSYFPKNFDSIKFLGQFPIFYLF